AVFDRLADARDVLVDDPSRAQVEVAHFAVAHLAAGQADRDARGVHPGARALLPEPVPVRGAGGVDGVVVLGFGVTPAVEDGEDHGARALGHDGQDSLACGWESVILPVRTR